MLLQPPPPPPRCSSRSKQSTSIVVMSTFVNTLTKRLQVFGFIPILSMDMTLANSLVIVLISCSIL
ncbi:hypothetical protein LINPERPRIM_LOCUS41656 [Linum perenne]